MGQTEVLATDLYNEIYKDVEKKTAFSTWIAREIKRFNLEENEDYWKDAKESTGGRPKTEYILEGKVAFMIKQRSELSSHIGLKNRKEIVFFSNLEDLLSYIEDIKWMSCRMLQQYKVGNFYADCYFPHINTVIEYDEQYHNTPQQKAKDDKREAAIIKELGCSVIRVKEGYETKGFGEIINRFIELNI